LASNSLLEALVFAERVAEDVRGHIAPRSGHGTPHAPHSVTVPAAPLVLRRAMSRLVGLERNGDGLHEAARVITQIERAGAHEPALLNLTAAATLIVAGAMARHESRGGHFRTDYPLTQAIGERTFLTMADAQKIVGEDRYAARQTRAAS
jgi:L-aspartate oxidase